MHSMSSAKRFAGGTTCGHVLPGPATRSALLHYNTQIHPYSSQAPAPSPSAARSFAIGALAPPGVVTSLLEKRLLGLRSLRSFGIDGLFSTGLCSYFPAVPEHDAEHEHVIRRYSDRRHLSREAFFCDRALAVPPASAGPRGCTWQHITAKFPAAFLHGPLQQVAALLAPAACSQLSRVLLVCS